jgi:hypothetical protein
LALSPAIKRLIALAVDAVLVMANSDELPCRATVNFLGRTQAMSTTSERLIEVAQTLPEPLLTEVLDDADFLRARQLEMPSQTGNASLASLCGGMENTQTFAGSPMAIQQQLRDDWR